MLHNHREFLADITAKPNEDLPRLVYADWLDEYGDSARAAFIRLHCERWQTQERKKEFQPLLQEITPLRAENEERWRAELPEIPGVTWGRFWRGFVSEASFDTPQDLLDHADQAFAAAPIQFVHIRKLTPESIEPICRLPQMKHLYGLLLEDVPLDVSCWSILTGSEWFAQLRHLIAYPTPENMDVSVLYYHPNDRSERNESIVQMVIDVAMKKESRLQLAHLAIPILREDMETLAWQRL